MDKETFVSSASAIFLAIAVLHGLRIFYGWPAVIGGWVVPMWLSWVALVIAGYLAYQGFTPGRR